MQNIEGNVHHKCLLFELYYCASPGEERRESKWFKTLFYEKFNEKCCIADDRTKWITVVTDVWFR